MSAHPSIFAPARQRLRWRARGRRPRRTCWSGPARSAATSASFSARGRPTAPAAARQAQPLLTSLPSHRLLSCVAPCVVLVIVLVVAMRTLHCKISTFFLTPRQVVRNEQPPLALSTPIVLIKPDAPLATPTVFKALDLATRRSEKTAFHSPVSCHGFWCRRLPIRFRDTYVSLVTWLINRDHLCAPHGAQFTPGHDASVANT